MSVLHRYVPVVRTPGAILPLFAVLASSAAIGMLDLALLFLARHLTGSLAVAGTVTGAFGIGNAVGLPVQGRLMDRRGPARVPAVAGPVCGAALLVLAVGMPRGVAAGPLIVLAFLAGLTLPATTAGTRTLLRELIADPGLRPAAYAVLGVLFQLGYLVGPVVVSGLLVAVGPRVAVCGAGLLATGSGLLFGGAAQGVVPTEPRRPGVGEGRPGAGVRTLVVGSLVGGVASGLIGIGVPAVAFARDATALGGVLLSVSAVGTLLGGLALGALWRGPKARDLWLAQLFAAGAALLAAACARIGSLVVFGCALLVVGVCAAPVSIVGSALLDVVAGRRVLTQAYGLLISAQLVSAATGYAVGAGLVRQASPAGLFAAAAAAMACAAAWTVARRATLRR